MIHLRKTKLAAAILAAATFLGTAPSAWAGANDCAPNAAVGSMCKNAGTPATQSGTCELTAESFAPGCAEATDASPASSTDAGASSASTCLSCLLSAQRGGCGDSPSSLSGAEFFKQSVSGCCNVAGTTDVSDGLGLLAGAGLLGLVLVQRRRAAR